MKRYCHNCIHFGTRDVPLQEQWKRGTERALTEYRCALLQKAHESGLTPNCGMWYIPGRHHIYDADDCEYWTRAKMGVSPGISPGYRKVLNDTSKELVVKSEDDRTGQSPVIHVRKITEMKKRMAPPKIISNPSPGYLRKFRQGLLKKDEDT